MLLLLWNKTLELLGEIRNSTRFRRGNDFLVFDEEQQYNLKGQGVADTIGPTLIMMTHGR